MRRVLFATAFGAALSPLLLQAQACVAPKGSNVARMLAWFEGPLAFAPLGPVHRLSPGAVIVGGDITWVPAPPASISHTNGVCYADKSEHPGLSSAFPRPRVIVGLPGGLSVEAMYLPPVTVADATPNMGSVALAWVTPLGDAARGLALGIRAHATFGQVQGPITCPRSELQQTGLPGCWGNRESKDTYRPNLVGGEVSVSSTAGDVRWYGGVGYSSLMPRFQVGFTYLNGTTDNSRVQVDLTRVSVLGGLSYGLTKTLDLTAQLYSVPDDATTGRLGIAWRLR